MNLNRFYICAILIYTSFGLTLADWQLIWSEEFNEQNIDQNKWTIVDKCYRQKFGSAYDTELDQEVSCYSNSTDNISLKNGTLLITVTERESTDGTTSNPWNYQYTTSGRINSRQTFRSGRLELRAAHPKGKYLYPLVWISPKKNPSLQSNDEEDSTTFHLINDQENQFRDNLNETNNSTDNISLNEFKYYSIEWNETSEFVLNIALGLGGSTYNWRYQRYIFNEWDCPSLIIDYIRYYQWTDEPLNRTVETGAENTVKASELCAGKPRWTLVWNDEFNGDGIDTDQWLIQNQVDNCETEVVREYSGNKFNKDICFTNDTSNIRQINGTLVLIAKEEQKNSKQFTSAWIKSKQDFRYGKLEIRAAMPKGMNLFSNFAIFPQNYANSVFPDFVWFMLNRQTNQFISRRESSRRYSIGTYSREIDVQANLNDFHTYSVEWNNRYMILKFDSEVMETYDAYPLFQMHKYFKLDLMLGVNVESSSRNISNSWDCPSLIIDYVRYYKLLSIADQQIDEETISSNPSQLCSNMA